MGRKNASRHQGVDEDGDFRSWTWGGKMPADTKAWTRMEISAAGDGEESNWGGGAKAGGRKLGCMIAGAVIFYILCSVRVVPPAHVGLAVTLGDVAHKELTSGVHILNPFVSVIKINLKTQLLYSENIVPTQEGLSVELDVALLYHVEKDSVRDIFLKLGENYESVLVMLELQSAVRGLTSEVSAKALYTSGRLEIRNKLMDELKEKLGPRGIILEDCLLKGIKLPKQLTDAIELKAQAEQGEAGGGAQEGGGLGYLSLPEDRERGHQPAAPAVEGHRGHREARQLEERQDRGHGQLEELASRDSVHE